MDDLKNLTAEKVIPVTPEKQEEMSWEPTTEPPVTPEKQEEEVLLWQPYQTPKYWAYHYIVRQTGVSCSRSLLRGATRPAARSA